MPLLTASTPRTTRRSRQAAAGADSPAITDTTVRKRSRRKTTSSSVYALPRILRVISPTIKVLGVDFGITLTSALLLVASKIVFHYVFVYHLGWPLGLPKNPTEDSIAALVSVTHSTLLLFPLGSLLLGHQKDPVARERDAPSKNWYLLADSLIQFCTGYMIQDFILILVKDYDDAIGGIFPFRLVGEDPLFLAHHVATVLYMSQCRHLKAGHYSAMLLMFFGELSNPFQNSWFIGKWCLESGVSAMTESFFARNYIIIGKLFAFTYGVLRLIIGPFVGLFIMGSLFKERGRKRIGLANSLLWSLMIVGVMVGSIPFAFTVALGRE